MVADLLVQGVDAADFIPGERAFAEAEARARDGGVGAMLAGHAGDDEEGCGQGVYELSWSMGAAMSAWFWRPSSKVKERAAWASSSHWSDAELACDGRCEAWAGELLKEMNAGDGANKERGSMTSQRFTAGLCEKSDYQKSLCRHRKNKGKSTAEN